MQVFNVLFLFAIVFLIIFWFTLAFRYDLVKLLKQDRLRFSAMVGISVFFVTYSVLQLIAVFAGVLVFCVSAILVDSA